MITLLGWLGAGVLLAAYALVSTGRLAGDGVTFQCLNVAGGVALATNSAYHGAWPSAALNIVWIAVGVAALAARHRRLSAARNRQVSAPAPAEADPDPSRSRR